MTSKALDNLAEIGQLKREAPDQTQIDGLIGLAKERLADLDAQGISQAGKFSAAYSAAHSLALAALRWHGFGSNNRYQVFQCLQHTLGLESSKWRVLDTAHKLRNRLEYEGVGNVNVEERLLTEIIQITRSAAAGSGETGSGAVIENEICAEIDLVHVTCTPNYGDSYRISNSVSRHRRFRFRRRLYRRSVAKR